VTPLLSGRLGLLLALTATACAGRAGPPVDRSGPPEGADTPAVVAATADPADREGRARIVDGMVEILAENYVPPDATAGSLTQGLRAGRDELLGIEDPDAFYEALNEALRAGENQHLYVYRPGRDLFNRDAADDRLVGAAARDLDGHVFVDDVWEGGPAHEAGLRYGDELLPIEGQAPFLDPIPADLETITLWVRRSRDTEPFFLTIEPVAGDTLWYLAESTRASIQTVQMGACRIGLIHLRTFADKSLVEELATGAHFNETDGLIVDLRGNRGGEIRLAGEMLDLLSREPSVWIQYRNRQYPFPATSWNRPLVVLVDEQTRSAAELYAAAVQIRKLGTLVGSPTAGQVQGSRLFSLPDGSRLLVPITRVTLPGGAPLEEEGVIPDFIVPRPLMYAGADDPPMARAMEILGGLLACPEPLPPERFPQEQLAPGEERR
jgi:carboxyl-terminal processing protease